MNKSVLLVSSVPPRSPVRSLCGVDVTGRYRELILQSWKDVTENILSLNAASETQECARVLEGISVVDARSDGASVIGRPLVLLAEMISVCERADCDFVVLTNADIYIHDSSSLLKRIQRLRPGHALVSQRLNVGVSDEVSTERYRWGYDLFALHRKDVVKLCEDGSLFFGEPWWDYHAICNLVLNNIQVEPLLFPHVLHLFHVDAYTWERWTEIAGSCVKRLENRLRRRRLRPVSLGAQNLADAIVRCKRDIHPTNAQRMVTSLKCFATSNALPAIPNAYERLQELSCEFELFSREVLGFDDFQEADARDAYLALVSGLNATFFS